MNKLLKLSLAAAMLFTLSLSACSSMGSGHSDSHKSAKTCSKCDKTDCQKKSCGEKASSCSKKKSCGDKAYSCDKKKSCSKSKENYSCDKE